MLAVIPARQGVALHHVSDELDRKLELALEEELDQLFSDCQPGAIPPFGKACGIKTVSLG